MPRRVTLTDRQKDALLRLPTSQTDLWLCCKVGAPV